MHHKIHLTKNFSRTMLNVSLAVSLFVVTLGMEVVMSDIQSVVSPTITSIQQPSQSNAVVSWNKLAQIQASLA